MSKILIIDDEESLVLLLKDELEERGHEVLTAFDGEEGIVQARKEPDLIILDIMMPKIDGFEMIQRIRDDVFCPIIFLSAKQSERDKLKGLTLGGDDYVTKPFGLAEFLARIEASLRRDRRTMTANREGKKRRLYCNDLTFDLGAKTISFQGEVIPFTKKEYEILELFALHPGQVFSREQIYENIWGYDGEGDSATVTEHIKKIRRKLEDRVPGREFISTVWGIGYRWNKQV